MTARAVSSWCLAGLATGVFSAALTTETLSGDGGAQAAGAAPRQGWVAPRTPWGDSDIQGVFTTDDELGVPFERLPQFGEREVVTEAEFRDRQSQAARQAAADAEEFVVDRTGGRGDGTDPSTFSRPWTAALRGLRAGCPRPPSTSARSNPPGRSNQTPGRGV